MKDCRNCIWYDQVLSSCGNYLCRNQSEYDEYVRRKTDGSDGGDAAAGRPDRGLPVL